MGQRTTLSVAVATRGTIVHQNLQLSFMEKLLPVEVLGITLGLMSTTAGVYMENHHLFRRQSIPKYSRKFVLQHIAMLKTIPPANLLAAMYLTTL